MLCDFSMATGGSEERDCRHGARSFVRLGALPCTVELGPLISQAWFREAGDRMRESRRVTFARTVSAMSDISLDQAPGDVTAAAHDAARGKVVYLTEHGERLAAIVPAELAAELEGLTPEEFRELLEDFADAQAARESLTEIEAGAKPVPAEQVWAELGLDS